MRRCLGSLLHVLSSYSGRAATCSAVRCRIQFDDPNTLTLPVKGGRQSSSLEVRDHHCVVSYQKYVVYRARAHRYCRAVTSLNRSKMNGQSEGTLAVSKVGAARSIEWMHRVIRLLDATIGQLHDLEHPAQATLLEVVSLLRQQINLPPAGEVRDGRGRLLAWQARKVRDYIDSHITGPVFIVELCALIQRSEAHFSRSFKRTFGESPHSFIMRRRVELAAGYMLTTDAPLSDIAACCGFADQPHLCKHFRQAMGQTPAAWRRVQRLQRDESKPPPVEHFAMPWRNRAPVAVA
jgi:AraC family transcriptional regulator